MYEGGASAYLIRPTRRRSGEGPRAIVGVTGGIGAGKSSVTTALAGLGAVIADADKIAREVVDPGTEGLALLVQRFGRTILTDDEVLDRARLAALVFDDPAARQALNEITHPLISDRAWSILNGAPQGSLAVYDVPLLVENGYAELFDAVIVVDAPIDSRLDRLAERGLSRADALRRINAQATLEQRRAVASIWIDNAGSRKDLVELMLRMHGAWL